MYDGVVYSLPKPNRHHDVIRLIFDQTGSGISGPDVQGFLTDDGTFVNRVDALAIAIAANQVLEPSNIRANRLFSEDLW
jgi:hypothetical protein